MEMGQFIDIQKGLEYVGNDTSLYTLLLDSFLTEKVFDEARLKKLIKEGQLDEASKYIHFFNGAALQVGADPLGSTGTELCAVLQKKRQGNIREQADTFIDLYKKTYDCIKTERKRLS